MDTDSAAAEGPAAAPSAAALPDAAPPPNRKRLIIAAAATGLLLSGVAATALWWALQPGAPAKKAQRAVAAASASASASAVASTIETAASAVASPPPAPLQAASAPMQAAASAPTQVAASTTDPAQTCASAPAAAATPAADTGISSVAAAARAPRAAPSPGGEVPLDRLQRRLAEVLGPSVSVDAARAGELRVLNRSHSAVPDRGVPGAAGWGYSGMTGPRRWARLDPAFSTCASGRQQSPIDIRGGIAGRLEPVHFDYRAGHFTVRDTGHTVQVDAPPGNAIELGGVRYELQQLHFHRPSEERIDGRQFEMDVHLVHRDRTGRLAVVAVLLQRGAAQPLLRTVWAQLSTTDDEAAAMAQIDPRQLLPQDQRYYSYVGSLTTPPCTEGVLWLVLQQPLTVSAQQIDAFAQRYPVNARPLQPAAGRVIRQSM